jgi:hypothetical protein
LKQEIALVNLFSLFCVEHEKGGVALSKDKQALLGVQVWITRVVCPLTTDSDFYHQGQVPEIAQKI